MNLFETDNYRDFLRKMIKSMPSRGHGQLAKISLALDVNPSIVTAVLKDKKDFTLEQASDLAQYLGLSELETDYFLVLVSLSRAGKESLRATLKRQLKKLRERASTLKDLIPPKRELGEEVKSIFYSQWYFSAIRILTSIDEFHSIESIAKRLSLPRAKVKTAVDFLLKQGLCVEENGKLRIGAQSTHLGNDSPLITRHHANWRERSIFHMENRKDDELNFTSPVSIATKDIPRVRKILVDAIENSFKVIDPSNCEEVACLNIDWFRY